MSGFGSIEAKVKRGTCPGCGKNPTAGQVTTQVRRFAGSREIAKSRVVTSKSRSLCETCAVELFEKIERLYP